jgi:hypothetical protein
VLQWHQVDGPYDTLVSGVDRATRFELYKGEQRTRDALKKRFLSELVAIDRYFTLLHRALNSSQLFFVAKFLPRWLSARGSWFHSLFASAFEFIDQTTMQVMLSCTSNTELIGTLTYLWGDHGIQPNEAPFALHALYDSHLTICMCYSPDYCAVLCYCSDI